MLFSIKKLAKNIVILILGFFLFCSKILKFKLRNKLTIFTFHEVTDRPSEFLLDHDLSVTTDLFKTQIGWINRHFNIVNPKDLERVKNLPKNAAIISFDDGFIGTFENGLSILRDMGLPSIVFLNMRSVIENEPLISATALYLDKYSAQFSNFAAKQGLKKPYQLTLTPILLETFQDDYGCIEFEKVIKYQGELANIDVVSKWDKANSAVFGNHLYQHWNAKALTNTELKQQYLENESHLTLFANHVNFFAFTNGHPDTCFSKNDVDVILGLGASKVFSASGRVNNDFGADVLDRVSVSSGDTTIFHLWFKLGRYLFLDLSSKKHLL